MNGIYGAARVEVCADVVSLVAVGGSQIAARFILGWEVKHVNLGTKPGEGPND